MRININMKSLGIYSGYKKNIIANSAAMEKISSGKKINSAKDNPLKIEQSENFRMQIRALEMANKNLQDSTSMIQVADTAMGTISEALIRMKELTVQAANEVTNEADRKIIQGEIDELTSYINDTAKNTEFNGNKLLVNGNVTDNSKPDYVEMQIGANVGDSIGIPFFNVSSETLGIDKLDVVNDATKALNSIDEALKDVNGCRAKYGAVQNRLENSIEITSSSSYIYEKSSSDINDADIALEMAEIARTSILMESATAMMAQSNNFPKDMLNILANLRK
ncbi:MULTISPECIES: flagellin [Clostridia]|mgnify:FL=1|uniref:Flagellin n=2 Tax=Clostridia TaxID=186801 RepID=A0A8I0A8A4_9CLOT|nr:MULTISPECIES: flagellin [Clostridia]MBC5640890.1 flagellin [Clostridium lentum]MBC5655158.1 flagellin [Blautia lenta]